MKKQFVIPFYAKESITNPNSQKVTPQEHEETREFLYKLNDICDVSGFDEYAIEFGREYEYFETLVHCEVTFKKNATN